MQIEPIKAVDIPRKDLCRIAWVGLLYMISWQDAHAGSLRESSASSLLRICRAHPSYKISRHEVFAGSAQDMLRRSKDLCAGCLVRASWPFVGNFASQDLQGASSARSMQGTLINSCARPAQEISCKGIFASPALRCLQFAACRCESDPSHIQPAKGLLSMFKNRTAPQ